MQSTSCGTKKSKERCTFKQLPFLFFYLLCHLPMGTFRELGFFICGWLRYSAKGSLQNPPSCLTWEIGKEKAQLTYYASSFHISSEFAKHLRTIMAEHSFQTNEKCYVIPKASCNLICERNWLYRAGSHLEEAFTREYSWLPPQKFKAPFDSYCIYAASDVGQNRTLQEWIGLRSEHRRTGVNSPPVVVCGSRCFSAYYMKQIRWLNWNKTVCFECC